MPSSWRGGGDEPTPNQGTTDEPTPNQCSGKVLSECEAWKQCVLDPSTCKTLEIKLFASGVHGTIPDSIALFTALETLRISNCGKLSGTIPASIGALTNMVDLALEANSLEGEIPGAAIASMKRLTTFSVKYNHRLSGTLAPQMFGQLTKLQSLDVSTNIISGTIPDFSNCSQLQTLALYKNQLSGTVPSSLGSLSNLQTLYIDNNYITGAGAGLCAIAANLSICVLSPNPSWIDGNLCPECLNGSPCDSARTPLGATCTCASVGGLPCPATPSPSPSLVSICFGNAAAPWCAPTAVALAFVIAIVLVSIVLVSIVLVRRRRDQREEDHDRPGRRSSSLQQRGSGSHVDPQRAHLLRSEAVSGLPSLAGEFSKHASLLLDPRLVTMGGHAGRGGQGVVRFGSYDGRPCVLKAVFAQLEDGSQDDEFWREAEMLSGIDHPRITKLFGVLALQRRIPRYRGLIAETNLFDGDDTVETQLFMVMEEVEVRCVCVCVCAVEYTAVHPVSPTHLLFSPPLIFLSHNIHTQTQKRGSIEDIDARGEYIPKVSWHRHACQLLDTVAWLHERGIVHRDIKPSNLLVDLHDDLKICDLGISRKQTSDGSTNATLRSAMTVTIGVGTAPYMPPGASTSPPPLLLPFISLSHTPHRSSSSHSLSFSFAAPLVNSLARAFICCTEILINDDARDGLDYTRIDGRAADIYSTSMTLIQMWSCAALYPGAGLAQLLRIVPAGGRPTFPARMPEALRRLLSAMYATDSSARPRADAIAAQLKSDEMSDLISRAFE